MKRRTFTAHWILCLVCLGVFSFAWRYGVPQLVYQSDHSMMTSAIAVLVVVTAAWLGWQAWEIDSVSSFMRKYPGATLNDNADFGHLAESLAVKLGLIGTGVGVMMTISASLQSANPLDALRTAFFSFICGAAASALISLMTHNLESGIKRAGR